MILDLGWKEADILTIGTNKEILSVRKEKNVKSSVIHTSLCLPYYN